MYRRTKILATLGPASDSPGVLEGLLREGANVFRLNFSHGSADDHRRRACEARVMAERLELPLGLLGDLQGPKIRIAGFAEGAVELLPGESFILDASLDPEAGDASAVGLDYADLPRDLSPGDILLLDDGRLQLEVVGVSGPRVETRIRVGGRLSSRKGINKRGGGLSAPALTAKDHRDLVLAAEIGVDFLAVSFPRSGADMHQARKLAREAGVRAQLVAKVERAETVVDDAAIDDIILASDAVMVARGDLGVEIGDPELMGVQKRLIRRARRLNRAVITATQMMESMIQAPLPTRAEVMDVANAVLDGTDAVMLSAETAAGDYPVETVAAMARVCLGAEKHPSVNVSRHRLDCEFEEMNEALAMAAMYAANHLQGVRAIVALTESGSTPLLLSRVSSGLPIFALSGHAGTLQRCTLYRGVYPVRFELQDRPIGEIASCALQQLQAAGYLDPGDRVILTHGDDYHAVGGTNSLKLLEVGAPA